MGLRQVALALPFPREKKIKVLDIGGGWGPLSEQILIHRPNAVITLVDISERMLEHARIFLSRYKDRITFEQRDLTKRFWWHKIGGPFDAVVSSHAIHNLERPKLIKRAYSDILHLLKPHSYFFNLEIIFSPNSNLERIRKNIYWAENIPNEDDKGERTDPRSIENQLKWLRSAGFVGVDCLWLEEDKALICGSR